MIIWVGVALKDFFQQNLLRYPINNTRIILIPKNNNPYLLNHFRPIHLCNVAYKIISNVLVNRLQTHIGKIISPFQNAFVPKRHVSYNIALAHEPLHTMKNKKYKTSYIAIKNDIEKAYDKLEWNFTKNAQQKVNFPIKLINWIMKCIVTVNYSLQINGHITESWKPQRGLRQGDSLPHYIFILCLNLLILKFVEGHRTKEFDGLQINKNTPNPNLVFCRDDCIIFCKTNDKSINFYY